MWDVTWPKLSQALASQGHQMEIISLQVRFRIPTFTSTSPQAWGHVPMQKSLPNKHCRVISDFQSLTASILLKVASFFGTSSAFVPTSGTLQQSAFRHSLGITMGWFFSLRTLPSSWVSRGARNSPQRHFFLSMGFKAAIHSVNQAGREEARVQRSPEGDGASGDGQRRGRTRLKERLGEERSGQSSGKEDLWQWYGCQLGFYETYERQTCFSGILSLFHCCAIRAMQLQEGIWLR